MSRDVSQDQERWGGRRLLQEMDNSSLEELEFEEPKNCTAPGKKERRTNDRPMCCDFTLMMCSPARGQMIPHELGLQQVLTLCTTHSCFYLLPLPQ